MKALAVVLSLASVTSVFGQMASRGFGSVVFPGGGHTASPGITRSFGSVVFPGAGGATQVGRGQPSNFRRIPTYSRGTVAAPSYIYAFPVYVGGGYDNSYAPQDPPPQQQQQPPQQQPAVPVMIQVGPDGQYTTLGPRQPMPIYEVQRQPETVDEPEPANTSTPYLLAFKDHTILSAVAYWVDGETLHYFTTGSTHNQVSMSLLDRELTERLNRELGTDFKLPPAK
jgi:hypothetical protein